MEWNPSDTVTVGGVFVGFILLMLGIIKMVGQRTDPLLANALQSVIDSNSKSTAANEKSDERWANMVSEFSATVGNNTVVMEAMKIGMETVFTNIVRRIETSETNALARQTEILEGWRSFRETVKGEHSDAYNEILRIAPKIEELTQAQTTNGIHSEGLKRVMDDAMITQHKTNGEILKALQRIQQTLDDIKREFPERIEKVEQDMNALKKDIIKTGRHVKVEPAPANQPVVMPESKIELPNSYVHKPSPDDWVAKIEETKTETKDEKEEPK